MLLFKGILQNRFIVQLYFIEGNLAYLKYVVELLAEGNVTN